MATHDKPSIFARRDESRRWRHGKICWPLFLGRGPRLEWRRAFGPHQPATLPQDNFKRLTNGAWGKESGRADEDRFFEVNGFSPVGFVI